MVLARMLLESPAADGSRTAQAGFSHRLHLGECHVKAGKGMGCLVRFPHGETWAVKEACLHWNESGRRIRLHMGYREPQQGFMHLRRQSRDESRGFDEARRAGYE